MVGDSSLYGGERTLSNSHALCGKKALDPSELKAIHEVAVKNYPFERLETKVSAEKEMKPVGNLRTLEVCNFAIVFVLFILRLVHV